MILVTFFFLMFGYYKSVEEIKRLFRGVQYGLDCIK